MLAVAVQMDDHVGAARECHRDAVVEARDQAAVAAVGDDPVRACLQRDVTGRVCRAVVDDDHLDVADPDDPSGYGRDDRADGVLLVESRDHDYQVRRPLRRRRPGGRGPL